MPKYVHMRIPPEFKLRIKDVKMNMSKQIGVPIKMIPDTMVLRIVSNAHIYIPDKIIHRFFQRWKV